MAGPDLQAFLHATTRSGVLPRRLAGRVPRVRPGHQPAGHAAGQRPGPDCPAGQVGRRPRCAAAGEYARNAAAHRRRRRHRRCAGRSGRGDHRPGSARRPSCGRRFPATTSPVVASCSRGPRPGGSTGPSRRRRRPATGSPSASRWAGMFDTVLASPAAWCPVSLVPYRRGRVGTYPHIVDRGKPGLIAVLSNGKRFVNEADGYYQFTSAMIAAAPDGEEVAAWLICDHAFQRRYPFGMSKPFPVPVWPYVRSGYLKRGRTLEELARICGIDPAGLARHCRSVQRARRRRRGPRVRSRHAARSTAGPATPSTGPTRPWPRSRRVRSTRSRCCPAASARSRACKTDAVVPRAQRRRASRFRASTPPAATRPT